MFSVPWGEGGGGRGEDILSTWGDSNYRGGYHDKCGGYHQLSLPTCFMFRTMGRYHDTCVGDVQYPYITISSTVLCTSTHSMALNTFNGVNVV